MKRNTFRTVLLMLMISSVIIISGRCFDDTERPMCQVTFANESFSVLKFMYWKSESGSGAISIDIPAKSSKDIEIDALPGSVFNFKVTTINTGTEYVEWSNINHASGTRILYRIYPSMDGFSYIGTTYFPGGGSSYQEKPSTANTLPSI